MYLRSGLKDKDKHKANEINHKVNMIKDIQLPKK